METAKELIKELVQGKIAVGSWENYATIYEQVSQMKPHKPSKNSVFVPGHALNGFKQDKAKEDMIMRLQKKLQQKKKTLQK